MTVPDYISPVVGYRVWHWDATGLTSLNGERWVAQQPLSAVCRADASGSVSGLSKATHNPAELPYFNCTCGVYAARTIAHLHQCGYKKFGVHGEVYLWGKVVEHERGWRAQFAYPKTLFLAADAIPFTLSEIDIQLKSLTAFNTDIFIRCPQEKVRLWRNGFGYDAAGLDHLIKMRKEYYVRQSEHRLREGDRVAVLGHGIAIVEHSGEKEVVLLLGRRTVLQIARKNVVRNQRNSRWECEAANATERTRSLI